MSFDRTKVAWVHRADLLRFTHAVCRARILLESGDPDSRLDLFICRADWPDTHNLRGIVLPSDSGAAEFRLKWCVRKEDHIRFVNEKNAASGRPPLDPETVGINAFSWHEMGKGATMDKRATTMLYDHMRQLIFGCRILTNRDERLLVDFVTYCWNDAKSQIAIKQELLAMASENFDGDWTPRDQFIAGQLKLMEQRRSGGIDAEWKTSLQQLLKGHAKVAFCLWMLKSTDQEKELKSSASAAVVAVA